MPTAEDRQVHLQHVLYCEDGATAASTRYERTCAQIESAVEPLLKECVNYYDEFRMWEATVDRYWSENPNAFDEEVFRTIENISQKWQNVFRVLTDLLDAINRSEFNVNLPSTETIRIRYRLMLSIEIMDNSSLPKHLSELAENAKTDYDSGEVEEIVRG